MKLFKDDNNLIFKYFKIIDDINTYSNIESNSNKFINSNSPINGSKSEIKGKETYFTVDDIEKSMILK
jgi:hypothetical protein